MRLFGRSSRRSLTSLAVLLTAAIMSAPVPSAFALHMQPLHEKKHDAKRQVEALEERWRQAQLSGDVATMDSLLSDDYIGISMTGQVNTKMQQLDRMRSHKLALSKLDLGEMQVKLVGAIAIVTSRAEVEGTNEGIPVKGTYRYTRGLPTPALRKLEDHKLRGHTRARTEKRSGESSSQSRHIT